MNFDLKSYAKINLGLRILNKRNDGYHNIETIFYPLKLHDDIYIQIDKSSDNFNSVILKSNKSYIPLNKDNLCYKAVEKFFRIFEIKDFYILKIDLKKIIPVGGGLGGGSSNAATILKCLIKYFNINIESNKKKILELALSIGSDVPFFLLMKPCYAEGRGEKMKILNNFRLDYDILIVNPNLHVSTKWAFEKLDFDPELKKEFVLKDMDHFDLKNPAIFKNDFEELVFRKYNLLREIKNDFLNLGAVYSSMSGSGATMYGLFYKNKKDILLRCLDYFKNKNFFTFVSD